jgi:ribose-phosphate pyrophosphokinase
MRQDIRFHAGEAVNAKIFAKFISAHVDWLVTVDPHLHRIHDLAEVYSIPQRTLTAVPLLAQWLEREIKQPLLIGPDSESEQWVANIAKMAHAPYIILEKIRKGDRDVQIALPDLQRYRDHTPVLIDDIISTGHTLLEVIAQLHAANLPKPVCAAVHGLFAENAEEKLLAADVQRIVTCNTVVHHSNAIDVSTLLTDAVLSQIAPL